MIAVDGGQGYGGAGSARSLGIQSRARIASQKPGSIAVSPVEKMGGSEEPPKFREETSKKQRKALHDLYGHAAFAVAT
jgi:hypothetical protein